MSKIEDVTMVGGSGTRYGFEGYSLDTEFNAVSAVYAFTRRYWDATRRVYRHALVYIGETMDLSSRFDNHHKAPCIRRQQADCICVLVESSEHSRKQIERDLIQAYSPVCNG